MIIELIFVCSVQKYIFYGSIQLVEYFMSFNYDTKSYLDWTNAWVNTWANAHIINIYF